MQSLWSNRKNLLIYNDLEDQKYEKFEKFEKYEKHDMKNDI
ncbi:hypothetical protein pb186bvf_011542 [Paramecium bursaria]